MEISPLQCLIGLYFLLFGLSNSLASKSDQEREKLKACLKLSRESYVKDKVIYEFIVRKGWMM